MKKLFSITMIVTLVAFILVGCGGGKYADAKAIMNKYIDVVEKYLDSLEKANNAKDVAKAINHFADDLETVMPAMKKMAEKYPELKDHNNPPPELKEDQARAMAIGKRMGQSFAKIAPYMNDPDVAKAQKRIMKVMGGQS